MNTWWTWLHPSCLLTSETLIDLNEMSMLTHHLIIFGSMASCCHKNMKRKNKFR
jgi:hypothetical protein